MIAAVRFGGSMPSSGRTGPCGSSRDRLLPRSVPTSRRSFPVHRWSARVLIPCTAISGLHSADLRPLRRCRNPQRPQDLLLRRRPTPADRARQAFIEGDLTQVDPPDHRKPPGRPARPAGRPDRGEHPAGPLPPAPHRPGEPTAAHAGHEPDRRQLLAAAHPTTLLVAPVSENRLARGVRVAGSRFE